MCSHNHATSPVIAIITIPIKHTVVPYNSGQIFGDCQVKNANCVLRYCPECDTIICKEVKQIEYIPISEDTDRKENEKEEFNVVEPIVVT